MSIHALKDYYLSLEEKETEELDIEEEFEDEEIVEDEEVSEEAYQEFIYLSEVQEELEVTFEGLMEISNSIEATLDNGGLDPVAAQFAHLAVESYTSRMGIPSSDILPSLEAFGGDSGRHSATTVSLEAVNEKLKKAWETIKKVANSIWESIKNFFSRWLTALGRTKALLVKVQKRHKALGNAKLKNTDSKMKVSNSIQFGGEVDFSSINNGLKATNDTTKIMSGSYVKGVAAFMKTVGENILSDDFKTEKSMAELGINKGLNDKAISGDKKFKIGESGIPAFSGDSKEALKGDALKIAIPSITDIGALLTNVNDLLTASEGLKKDVDEVEKVKTVTITKVDNYFKNKLTSFEATIKAKVLQRNYLKPAVQLAKHNYGVCKAALKAANTAMGHYDGKSSTKEEEEAPVT